MWYLCFVAAILLLIATGALVLNKKLGMMRALYGMVGLAAIGFVLYIPAYLAEHTAITALLSNFINVLQIISLDADPLQCYDQILVALGQPLGRIYSLFVVLVHAALPVVSAMTAVTLILRCLSMLRMWLLRGSRQDLYVFSQMNYHSLILAEDIRNHDDKCKIVFLGDNPEADSLAQRDRIRCQVLDETMEHLHAAAKHRQVHYYCIHEDREENLNQALSLLAQLKEEDPQRQSHHHIFLFSDDPMVELMVDSLDKGLVELNVVNEACTAVYQLLSRHPLTQAAKNQQISVALVGHSKINIECLRAVCWCGQLYNHHLKVRLLGDFPQHWAENFRMEYPGLFSQRYDVELIDCKHQQQLQEALLKHCADAGYIVVADEKEEETLRLAVWLRRLWYHQDPQHAHAPKIFAYTRKDDKANAVANLRTAEARADRKQGYDIIPFGMAAEIYSFDQITDSALEKLAKNVHLVYEDIFSDGPIDVPAALSRYNLFETNKRSNRANALHIQYKLAMLGLALSTDPQAEEVSLQDHLDDETLAQLTYAEHDRWMAFLESEGWHTATLEDVAAYQASGISKGRHNCPLLKMHPYICPFEELQARSEALGLPDSTVYDRELITRIPDIVHDHWGVTGKKYKIVKIPTGGK